MGLSRSLITNINKFLLKKIKPDATFLCLINEKNLKIRLNLRKKKNRYDNFNIKFYKKIQNGFLKISNKKRNYILINSNNSLVSNKIKVLNHINKLIK